MDLPRIKTIFALIDTRTSIKEWVQAVSESIPGPLRERVMSQLFLVLLDMRSALHYDETHAVEGSMIGASCFEVAMDISIRRILAARALDQCCHVFVVPQTSLSLARKRLKRAAKRVAVEVLGLETAFATAIIIQAGTQFSSIISTWEEIISRYNRSVRNDTLPFIHVKWKNRLDVGI